METTQPKPNQPLMILFKFFYLTEIWQLISLHQVMQAGYDVFAELTRVQRCEQWKSEWRMFLLGEPPQP